MLMINTTSAENQSADIRLSLPVGKKITIYWGDGTSTVVTGEVSFIVYSHTYTDIGAYNLTVSGDYNDITYLVFMGDGSYGGDIRYMPDKLQIISSMKNTFYGELKKISRNLLSLSIEGTHNITGGAYDFPKSLTYLNFICKNMLPGNILDFSRVLTFLRLWSSCNTGGDIANLPDGLSYVNFSTWAKINYTGKIWTTNMSFFSCSSFRPGYSFSSSEIDQLLIDFDEDLDWSGGGKIYLIGTNAPRTSASDAAVNNIVAEGGTVITNN